MQHSVCHLTSVHPRNDTRIFLKELPAISASGYKTNVIVADGKGYELREGFEIFDIGITKIRLLRVLNTPKKVYQKAIEINAEIYHFHDPELIPVGLKLLKKGKKVIYDIHEDVPRDIQSKDWIWKPVRKLISFIFEKYEDYSAKRFSYLFTATPFIYNRFKNKTNYVLDLNNYPIKNELYIKNDWTNKPKMICYIGGLTKIRGIEILIEAMEKVNGKLFLAGTFDNMSFRADLMKKRGWDKVVELGQIDRRKASQILSESMAGIVLFLPEPNHVNSQPNKIFEYMSAGLPVICSNFLLWKLIIEDNNCGICTDPFNIDDIANAINYLLNNPDIACNMGLNGKNLVKEKFNWDIEKDKLLKVYEQLTSK